MPAIWIVRHAPTAANSAGVFMGSRDVPASAEGLAQARGLAAAIGEVGAVYASPLRRAVSTAQAAFPERTPRVDARLGERRLGSWEGLEKEALRHRAPEAFIGEFLDLRHTPAGGEPIEALCVRVRDFLEELSAADESAPALVVSHNGVIRVMRYLLRRCELDEASATPEPFLTPELIRWTGDELRRELPVAVAAEMPPP
jgi:broad specificity phosphatase PhoE